MQKKSFSLSGVVCRGLGEGTYFMSIQNYRIKIKKKLGFLPYPGTLNIKVSKGQINSIKKNKGIRIDGFENNDKKFGGLSCYKAKIKNTDGAIIFPDFTRHKDVIEFIAPVNLKSELKIKDSDKVKVDLV